MALRSTAPGQGARVTCLHETVRIRPGHVVIDLHTHGLPRSLPNFGRRIAGSWPELVHTGPCSADIMLGDRHFRSVTEQCWNLERRLADMETDGVARQVISPIPITFSYDLGTDGVADLARVQNEWIADAVRAYPTRFSGLGTVPLQDPDRAAEMVVEIRQDLRLAGVEIGSNVCGANLDDRALDPFFAACAEHGALVFVHPWQVLGSDRLRKYGLTESIGMGAETATAAASLVIGGVLDRHPELDILLAHGGGAFLALLPRIERFWENSLTATDRGDGPSSYADRFYYDSLLFDADAVAALVGRVGADRVVVGTDYPFAIAERPAGAALLSAGLPEAVVSSVSVVTAERILGLA
ncbi:amidohydrolase family protein [Mycolicibacterium hippocampi]|uniref:amidohydrolase family protein n=1 Tax=Mycobacteriaceae TaxID=1762 RepID=UPI00211655E4|nr:amidohydrolase family protein [Mycolicibacterium hippocampi]